MAGTPKLSNMDVNQIQRAIHDEELNATRVTLVGLDQLIVEPKIDLGPIIDQMKEYQKNSVQSDFSSSNQFKTVEVKVPIHTVETRVERIEVPVVIVQEKIVEVLSERLVFQDKVQVVEVPVLTKEVEYREIKIPVITERLKDDKVLKLFQVLQSIAVLGILIKMLLK